MISAPEFAAYPSVQAPVYSRWIVSGVALLGILSGVGAVLRSVIEPRITVTALVCAGGVWLLALLLRVLYCRLNGHNAQNYYEAADQVIHAWWTHHRQHIALVESVLISAACITPEQRQLLFSSEHQPPEPQITLAGRALHLVQIVGSDVAERERNLATLLALQWHQQCDEQSVVQPSHCYWQGSLPAWKAFVEQMALCFPQVQLPEKPEPWEGIRSLDWIIDQLQGARSPAHILCAGCESSPIQQEGHFPAGEAAVLWLFGPVGGVRFSRGEWFCAQTDHLPTVAERALQQRELTAPTPVCVSFAQPNVPDFPAIDWNTRQYAQDANFGTLENLQAMVVQTLAAWYAEQHQTPCAWLANDPHHTLALGIVEPNDSDS